MRFSCILLLFFNFSWLYLYAASTVSEHNQTLLAARHLADRRDYTRAQNILQTAIENAQQDNDEEWEALLDCSLGWLYEKSGQYAEAENTLNRSIYLSTRIHGPNSPDQIPALGNLGGLYYEAGQYSRAEKLISRALAIAVASNREPGTIATLQTNLGDIYFVEHKDTMAEQVAGEALKKFAMANDSGDGLARDTSLLAALYLRMGRLAEAESSFQKALSTWQAIHGPADQRTAEGMGNLALFYAATGQFEKAQPLFESAMAVFRKVGGDNRFLQNFLAEYGVMERKLGHKKEAKQITKQLDQLVKASAGNTISRQVVDVSTFR